jgi:alkylhydroperoxidase family enzyme
MAKESGADLIPRVPYEEFDAGLKEALRPKVERLGYCGEIWQIGANMPKSMLSFCNLTEDLKDEMPAKVVELVALTVAGVMGNVYERNQHERLADKLGYGRDWIAAVNKLEGDTAEGLSEDERKIQKFVIATIYRRGQDCTALFDDMARAVGPKTAVGVLMSVGRCIMHAIFVNALELEPPVTSIFGKEKAA